jgi:CheY-like chemotaxis protein
MNSAIFSPEDTAAYTNVYRLPHFPAAFLALGWAFAFRRKPKFTGNRRSAGACLAHGTEFACGHDDVVGGARVACFPQTAGTRMQKASLVSIVEDDQFFRESMKRLMRSHGHRVEAFASAADFLKSPRLVETACLIADVHMPAMPGIELYRQLIEAGYAIPTILVTAYPNDADRDRALKDGVVCYLRKPVDDKHLIRWLRAALPSGEPPEENS